MKMMQRVCLSVMIGLAVGVVSAQQWFVCPAGSDDPNGSFEQPFETIQQALNAAQDGDTIVLMPGVYSGQGNYDLSVDGLSLTIRSTQPDDWDTVEATVIDPQQQGGIFMFTIPDQGRIILEGLTFQNAFKEGKLSLSDLLTRRIMKSRTGRRFLPTADRWMFGFAFLPTVWPHWEGRFISAIPRRRSVTVSLSVTKAGTAVR